MLADHQLQINDYIDSILAKNLPETAYAGQLQLYLEPDAEQEFDGPTIDHLPTLVCLANNASPERAVPVTAAWQILRRAVKLFDDVEDGDIRDRPAEAINAVMGLLFIAQLALEGVLEIIQISPAGQTSAISSQPAHLALSQVFNRAILRACVGQHDDLTTGRAYPGHIDPEMWLDIAGAKSGELLGWAAWAGALVAGAGELDLTRYRQYGYHLGILLQVADDFNGIWRPDGPGDLTTGTLNLAVCYAVSVADRPSREQLITRLAQAAQGDNQAVKQARQRLIDLGAQAYLLVVGRVQRRQAITALPNVTNPAQQQLIGLLDRVLPAIKD